MGDGMTDYHKVSLTGDAYARLKARAETLGVTLSEALMHGFDEAERFNSRSWARNVRYEISEHRDKGKTYVDGRPFPWYTRAGVEKVEPWSSDHPDWMFAVTVTFMVENPPEFVDENGVARTVTDYGTECCESGLPPIDFKSNPDGSVTGTVAPIDHLHAVYKEPKGNEVSDDEQ